MKTENKDIIICSCCSIEHQIVFRILDHPRYGREVYANIHLSNYQGFWKRLWIGLKYAFGYKSIYGDWDEFMLNESHADKLQEIVNYLKETK